MQSTLKPYQRAASNRPEKLVRAIGSVINQSFQDWELVVVADNCQQTVDICKDQADPRISCIYSTVAHEKWGSVCRNLGRDTQRVEISLKQYYYTSKYTLYLDNDDYYSPDYLQQLFDAIQVNPATWYITDHFEYTKGQWTMVRANLLPNSAGTANIIHASTMQSRWPDSGTRGAEDWQFIKRLMNESKDYKHLDFGGYYVGHILNRYDV